MDKSKISEWKVISDLDRLNESQKSTKYLFEKKKKQTNKVIIVYGSFS